MNKVWQNVQTKQPFSAQSHIEGHAFLRMWNPDSATQQENDLGWSQEEAISISGEKQNNKRKFRGKSQILSSAFLKKHCNQSPTMAVCWSIGLPAKLCCTDVLWQDTLERSCRFSSLSISSGNELTSHQYSHIKTEDFSFVDSTHLKPSQKHPHQPRYGRVKTSL